MRGYGDAGAASMVTSARMDEDDPFAGDGAGCGDEGAFSSFLIGRFASHFVSDAGEARGQTAADMMMFAGLFDDDEEEMVNAIARRTRADGDDRETRLAELGFALQAWNQV